MPIAPGRRHRASALLLAVVAASVFLVFVTRVFLTENTDEPYPCSLSKRYRDLSLMESIRTYHWTMEQLTEERMRLYEGTIPLVCSEEDIEQVIPFGTFARSVAERYPHLGDAAQMTYRDFAPLLTEVWRDYDCHLAAIPTHPELLVQEMEREGSAASSSPQASYTFGVAQLHADKLIGREVIRARETLERVLLMLQASEEYLPLHASLRCAARGFTDVRNALSLFSDASQCLPASVSLPRSTMLK